MSVGLGGGIGLARGAGVGDEACGDERLGASDRGAARPLDRRGGDGQRTVERRAGGHALGEQAAGERLGRVRVAAEQDDLLGAAQADDAGEPVVAAHVGSRSRPTSGRPKVAPSPAMRASQASASSRPPPRQNPSMAATTRHGCASISSMSA